MNPVSENEGLKREIGVRSLTLAILNLTVGAGIFVIPAIVAQGLGAAAILAYLLCGALVFLIAVCFAEVRSRIAKTGGPYTYIETAFGRFPGFLANNIYWFGSVLGDAAMANALADTSKYFFPSLGTGEFRIFFFLLLFVSLALINIRSTKYGIRLVEILTFGKLIPLVALVIVGAGFVSPHNLRWEISPTFRGIGAASLILFYAFVGFEAALSNGGEIKNPKRTVPLGVLLGISSVLILYISIQLVSQGVLGAGIAAHKDSPLGAVAGVIFGSAGFKLIILASIISMLGLLGGEILSIPRILYAGGRDGLFPKVLAKVHPRFFTPHIAVFIYSLLDFFFAVFGGFKQLAIIASASSLIIYLGVALSALKLRNTAGPVSEKVFRAPGGILIPLLAAGLIVWLLSNLEMREIIGIVVFIIIFSAIYYLMQLINKHRKIKTASTQSAAADA